jgi:hypothetical protein
MHCSKEIDLLPLPLLLLLLLLLHYPCQLTVTSIHLFWPVR